MGFLDAFNAAFAAGVESALLEHRDRTVAVFDADWTLWSGDIGESFFRWLLAGRLLSGLGEAVLEWAEYERRVEENRKEAYAWCTAVMAGMCEADVDRYSWQFAFSWPNYRVPMATLVHGLQERGAEVWVVSASNRWTVAHAASLLGVRQERCIGMSVELARGVLTQRMVEPVIWEEGKVEAVRRWIGVRPALAFGDSLGDVPMLEHASHGFVLSSLSQRNDEMLALACRRGWPVQVF